VTSAPKDTLGRIPARPSHRPTDSRQQPAGIRHKASGSMRHATAHVNYFSTNMRKTFFILKPQQAEADQKLTQNAFLAYAKKS